MNRRRFIRQAASALSAVAFVVLFLGAQMLIGPVS